MKKILIYTLLLCTFFCGCVAKSKIKIYYPDEKQEKLLSTEIYLADKSNDKDKKILEELKDNHVLKSDADIKKISFETDLNNEDDRILSIDFKDDFIDLDSAGAEYENLILKSIVKTFGEAYNVKKVKLTINGENYESGHIAMDSGDYFDVE